MKTTLYPYTRQELTEIRTATYTQQGCRVDGFTFRLWRPYDKIRVWLSEDDPRVNKDVVILKLRWGGIELVPTDGFADEDLLQVLGALESRVLGRVTHGKPPALARTPMRSLILIRSADINPITPAVSSARTGCSGLYGDMARSCRITPPAGMT